MLPARDPVCCPSHGHLFCRECAISNLLAQSKELKRLEKEAERRRLEDEEEKSFEHAEANARAVEEFERIQAGLNVRTGGKTSEKIVARQNGKITVEQEVEGGAKGVKRRFELEEDELSNLAKDNPAKSRKRTSEQNGGNDELPSFWVPSKIPDNHKADLKTIKAQSTCPVATSDKPHDFTLKTLVTVNFAGETASHGSDAPHRTCPSCDKALSNSTKAVVARPCGHVLCKPCSDRFQKPPEKSAHDMEHDDTIRCYVCQEDVTPGRRIKTKKERSAEAKEKGSNIERGLVELSSEGTGFAGGGKNMVKKDGTAFQC